MPEFQIMPDPFNGLPRVWGIDYGAKAAGTTVIAKVDANLNISFMQSAKKADADAFLRDAVSQNPPTHIFLDAPLSVPLACRHTYPTEEGDFHYRSCDRELQAMSPMFLGGLTARAMKFAQFCKRREVSVFETYPAGIARHMGWQNRPFGMVEDWLHNQYGLTISEEPQNPHQFDALLALVSALRYFSGTALRIGDEKEGVVIL